VELRRLHLDKNNPGKEKPEVHTYFWWGNASESNHLQDLGGHGNETQISILNIDNRAMSSDDISLIE
jgi:hypothetical protein